VRHWAAALKFLVDQDWTAIQTAPNKSPRDARDCGMDIEYEGIRLTPEEIVNAAQNGDVHVIGAALFCRISYLWCVMSWRV
jgi:methylmalonyl-CoA mutase cobalamin-binding domain/chain